MAITPGSAITIRDIPRNVASICGGFVFRKTLSLVLPMPMLINYSLTNAAPPRDFECNKEKDAAGVLGARRQHKERNYDVEAEVSELETSKIRGRFKGLHAIQARSTLHPQTASPSTESCLSSQSYQGMGKRRVLPEKLSKERDSSSTARRSRSRNVITGALNLFEVHCEVRRDAAEVLMAMQDPIHLHREACLASTLSAKHPNNLYFGLYAWNLAVTSAAETLIHQLEESKEEEKAKEEVRNEVDEDPPHIASKSLANELISLVLGHVDVDITTSERER
ncbi:hypothetical protein ALC53_00780 [Atta colombica]|uniref:Uncharacterized protein n=1 Tax=Atta colombica TaxID=520822 RepID=A0A195BVM8_9HYME|nr:hypothetical protein ALC53_00780 [Atta colombica]